MEMKITYPFPPFSTTNISCDVIAPDQGTSLKFGQSEYSRKEVAEFCVLCMSLITQTLSLQVDVIRSLFHFIFHQINCLKVKNCLL